MKSSQNLKYLQPSAYSRRSSAYIDREFQIKYTRYILGLTAASSLLFMLPVLYFSNQNYGLFFNLADLFDPSLAQHLSRERIGYNLIFATAFIADLIFCYFFSKKLTAKIAGPVKILRNHIRLLSRGDFSLPLIHLRDDDEFKELISSYNYLFSLLKSQCQHELTHLKRLKDMTSNPVAIEIINTFIEERALRLNQLTDLPHPGIKPLIDEPPFPSRDSRRVS